MAWHRSECQSAHWLIGQEIIQLHLIHSRTFWGWRWSHHWTFKYLLALNYAVTECQTEQQFRLKGSLKLSASKIPGRFKYIQRTWLKSTSFFLALRAGNNPSHYFKKHGNENSQEKEKTKTMLCKATWYFILLFLSVHTPIPLCFTETKANWLTLVWGTEIENESLLLLQGNLQSCFPHIDNKLI